MPKKIGLTFALTLSLLVLSALSFELRVHAEDIHILQDNFVDYSEENIIIDNRFCLCGGFLQLISINDTGWVHESYHRCPDYPYGNDHFKSRTITTRLECSQCSEGVTESTIERKRDCRGYKWTDKPAVETHN